MSPARAPTRSWLPALAVCAASLLACAPARAANVRHAVGPPDGTGAWVATVLYRSLARARPDARSRAVGSVSPISAWGTPTELLVLASRRDASGTPWVRVLLDERPNGKAVWIDAEDTTLWLDRWRISVSLAHRRVSVYRRGRLVRVFEAVVGKPSTPTPTGLFAIAAELRQPGSEDFEGTWVLPLTAHSNVYRHFDGGDGQVALHGRGGASLLDPLGTALSHGCVRLANAAIGWIAAHVPVGTPVSVGRW